MNIAPLSEKQKSWALLAALWLLLVTLSALRPLAVPDEGRYAEVARWMVVSGDWLTPRLNGLPFFHKPPLLYWLQASIMSLFGVHAGAVRLVPMLAAGLMLVALYLGTRHIYGEAVARRAALMLGSSLGFLIGGQYVNHDMLVATWIVLAIGLFAFSFMAGERPHAMLARLGFVACALGLMTKGLIGIALPGLVLMLWLLWTQQMKKVLYLPWLSGLGLFVLIAVPWFVLAQLRYPALFDYLVVKQHFQRYTGVLTNNPQPWWFYLLGLVVLLFPWALLSLAALRRPIYSPVPLGEARAEGAREDANALAPAWHSLCWIWVLGITVFFSLPNSKLIGYVLPVLVPMALLASLAWQRLIVSRRFARPVFAGLLVFNLAGAAALQWQLVSLTKSVRSADVAGVLACVAQPQDTVLVVDDFPYDLPFHAQTITPLVVLGDWPALRTNAPDGWQRELFEGADFDARAAQVLQAPAFLDKAAAQPGHWLVLRNDNARRLSLTGWLPHYQGVGWTLYRSGLRVEGPVAPQGIGLHGCNRQAAQQG